MPVPRVLAVLQVALVRRAYRKRVWNSAATLLHLDRELGAVTAPNSLSALLQQNVAAGRVPLPGVHLQLPPHHATRNLSRGHKRNGTLWRRINSSKWWACCS